MKLLVIRMSSLGDVLLSRAFLENLPSTVEVDWVVSSAFAFALQGHPRIRKLIIFDKKTGFKGWLKLIRSTLKEKYDARVDLHVTLRTQFARIYFFLKDLQNFEFVSWRQISKERFRFLSVLFFKKATPLWLKPKPLWQRFAELGSNFKENKDAKLNPPAFFETESSLIKYGLESKRYFCIAPASQWKTKEWDVRQYGLLCNHLIKNDLSQVVILGRVNDSACVKLIELLTLYKTPFIQALAEEKFSITADLVKNASALIGGDTGLAHLAEAVGTPVIIIYGPTRPELGFGPRSEKSKAVFSDVICAPCSKDGKFCFRFTDPYACLKRVSLPMVLDALKQVMQK